MEVTTMPRAVLPEGDLAGDLTVDLDLAFAELVLADDELLGLELDALVAAEFGDPPASDSPRHEQDGGGQSRPGPRDWLLPGPGPAARTTAARRRNRQRSPPRAHAVFS
jgi:hypothetical protein